MKKLLGILASIGMISSWTTLVVACGDNLVITKIDLSVFNGLKLGAFDEKPTDQEIIDAFNIKNDNNINLLLITDVTVTDITDTTATIIANPDSTLYNDSASVAFNLKIALETFKDTELGFSNDKPTNQEILTLFNLKNNITLVLDTDVTMKRTETGVIITAKTDSQQVKGKITIDFSNRKDLSTFELFPFTDLDKKPENEQAVLDILNSTNGTDLEWHIDVEIDSLVGNDIRVTANPNSKKVTGSVTITFTVKINLSTYIHTKIKPFDKDPTDQDVLDKFNKLNSSKPELILKTDVEVIDKSSTKARIKANPNSKKYKGFADVTFSIKLNLDTYKQTKLNAFFEQPNDRQILDEFIKMNPGKPNLTLITDVTVTGITETGATIVANPESTLYTGSTPITFNIKTQLSKYDNANFLAQEDQPIDKDILLLFNQKWKLDLTLKDDVIIEPITTEKATITAKPNSQKVQGSTIVTFTIKKDLAAFGKELGAQNNPLNTAGDVLVAFNNTHGTDLNLNDDITITKITSTSAFIKAQTNSQKVKGSISVSFTIKTNLNQFANLDLGGFGLTPTQQQVFVKFKDKTGLKDIEFDKDVKIEIETNLSATITAETDSKLYTGSTKIKFKSVMHETKYKDNVGKPQTSYAIDLSGLPGVTEITDFGYYKSAPDVVTLVKMPTTITTVPTQLPNEITSLEQVFMNNKVFDQNISNWELTNVTNMNEMFRYAEKFNQNISNWDVSHVTNMKYTFSNAKKFNQDLSSWEVSNVTNMHWMFDQMDNFNNGEKPLNWGWKTRNVTDMADMFYGAKKFNQDISGWDVSNVKDMLRFFYNTIAFNNGQNPGESGKPLKWNTKSVTNMESLFGYTASFNQNISSWDVSNVIYMNDMFKNSKAFNQDISGWDVSKVTHHTDFAKDSLLANTPSYLPSFNKKK